jgi:glycosyltransferase involved in cell wall biosynthesis
LNSAPIENSLQPNDPPSVEAHDSIPNRRLNLAVVTRRFWPYSSPAEFAVADLASEIKKQGHDVKVMTVRWERTWPTHFQFQEFLVHRINRPTTGPWGSFRYLRTLNRELSESSLDGIIVFGLDDEAWSVTKSFAGIIPIVIRISHMQLGHQDHLPDLTVRQIFSLNSASQVLVESEWTAERLARHPSVSRHNISVVREGIEVTPEHARTPALHGTARVAIADAHPVLMVDASQPLVVCGAPLNGDQGMFDLLDAWAKVLKRFPKARLWILSEGKKSRDIWDNLLEQHMIHSIVMPGSFDDLTDAFQAADVYVHPFRSQEACGFLARALTHGVCPVVTSPGASPTIIENNVSGLVVEPSNPAALADALILALGNQDLRDRLGREALKAARSAYDIKDSVEAHLAPLVRLASGDEAAQHDDQDPETHH